MFHAPSEVSILGVYLPPFFLVCVLGLLLTLLITQLLNWTGLSRMFWHPPLALLAIWVLSSSLIGIVLIAP